MALKRYKVRSRLPTPYNTAIGRTVTRFSVIEARLRSIIYALLEVPSPYGRIAVRNPRVEDSLAMIQQLMMLRGFQTRVEFKGDQGLISACKKLERFRDLVSHGVWAYHESSPNPVLQVTAGTYQEGNTGPKVNARIAPNALNVTLSNFRDIAKSATEILKAIDFMGRELKRQHGASLKTRARQQSLGRSQKGPPGRQSPAKRQPRRKS